MDDPTFTNPLLYKLIQNRKSIPDLYAEKLVNQQIMTQNEVEEIHSNHFDYLNDELKNYEKYIPEKTYFKSQWDGFAQAPSSLTIWDTGISNELIWHVTAASIHHPPEFKIHPHLQKVFVNQRMKRLSEGKALDWATAEAIAFGSLMYQGFNVRLSGEDVGRGTFSQRHAMLVDQQTAEVFIPLNSMKGGHGGKIEIAHSILSEEAVLGFEYGYSIDNPNNLVIWEAQFGDFFNGAQIIIDTFVSSGETKWMVSSGLVMLLPHGYDGMASEHSSCRIERFLQMTDSKEEGVTDGDDVNMHVINPTTPAQYFHALRRQMVRNFRKPLIVVGPKTLLRLSDATSPITEFLPGTHFQNVIPDVYANPKSVKRVILCSGKHYYNLNSERINKRIEDVAIIRVESLCPFPVQEIQTELSKYGMATTIVWSQEEHRNMGAWNFVQPRFENLIGRRIKYAGRNEAGTPAVGVGIWHQRECANIVSQPFTI
jgi:probable 2-oxoglutarate dehydrogenase E1 component DHKTD1